MLVVLLPISLNGAICLGLGKRDAKKQDKVSLEKHVLCFLNSAE